MTSQESLFKLIRSFFSYHAKGFANIFIKIEQLSQELLMSKFKYQDSAIWWRHQWPELNLLKTRSFLNLSIIQKASQTKFYKIRISKSKSYSCSNSSTKMGKNKNTRKKSTGLQNGEVSELKAGAGFKDYKSGQKVLQIRKGITNRCRTALTLKSTLYFLDRRKRIGIISWTVSSYNDTLDEIESIIIYGQPYIPTLLTVCNTTSN